MSSKSFFLEQILHDYGKEDKISILELGCGTATYIPDILSLFPNLTYVGVEPFKESFTCAFKNLKDFPNAEVHLQSGYVDIPGVEEAAFDIVFSLSALEHVKQLNRFLKNSVRYAKKEGSVIHRYDLGHALYPSSFKERLQVFFGNHAPWILSEHNFVRYVSRNEVVESLERNGVSDIEKVTYHQMPNYKAFEKYSNGTSFDTLKKRMYQWELDASPVVGEIETSVRERLFPTVAIWSKK